LINSDDPLLRFSAFDAMYSYVSEEFYETQEIIISDMIAEGSLKEPNWENKDSVIAYIEQLNQIFEPLPEVSDRVHQINNAGYVIAEEIYEEDSHPIDEMPAVNEVIEETADVGWETQGEILQENTYDGVTLLLLQYFDGILY
jgi:hypothetical protein